MIKIKCQRKHNIIYVLSHQHSAHVWDWVNGKQTDFIAICVAERNTKMHFVFCRCWWASRCNFQSTTKYHAPKRHRLLLRNVQMLLTNKLMGIYRFTFSVSGWDLRVLTQTSQCLPFLFRMASILYQKQLMHFPFDSVNRRAGPWKGQKKSASYYQMFGSFNWCIITALINGTKKKWWTNLMF